MPDIVLNASYVLTHLILLTNNKVYTIINSMLQMTKLSQGAVKYVAHSQV